MLFLSADADGFARPFAGPGVGLGPLAPRRHAAAVPQSPVTPDFDQALDV